MQNMVELKMAESDAWEVYQRQFKWMTFWFWGTVSVLAGSVARFLYAWLADNWQPVWVSQMVIGVEVLVFIVFLLSVISNGRKREMWREQYWQEVNARSIQAARSDAIRDFKAAMIRDFKAAMIEKELARWRAAGEG